MYLAKKYAKSFRTGVYDNLGKYKINADCLKFYVREECYREIQVSFLQMIPLLEHTVKFEDADYILYEHMYARCEDYSDWVANHLKYLASIRKEGAEIIVVGKAANAEKLLNGSIPNITFWGDHYTEKLGKKFGMDIKEQYVVYDDVLNHLAIWPVNGCKLKCKFCRRTYMDVKFESLSLEYIKEKLDTIRLNSPERMNKISLRAENLTEYGIDIYGKQMLHELIKLIESYDEVEEIELPIGMCIGEITPEILDVLCNSTKINYIGLNIEAGTDRLLKLISKPHTCKQARDIFEKLHTDNPNIKISTNVLIGFPTETVGDMQETAKLIWKLRPDNLKINFFICSPNSPLANYQLPTDSCNMYHLKQFFYFFKKNYSGGDVEMEITSPYIDKNPKSRESIKKRARLNAENKERVECGLLPINSGARCKIRKKG